MNQPLHYRRFDSITLFHTTGITVEPSTPIEGHPNHSRCIRIHFADGSYTTIDCHSDEFVDVHIKELDMHFAGVQKDLDALKAVVLPEAE